MELQSFVIELTADGSPTLRLKNSNLNYPEKMPESMHHSGGAALETLYIYTDPFKKTLDAVKQNKKLTLSIGVVGLGLGYIELSILDQLRKNTDVTFSLQSFEKEAELSECFNSWLNECTNPIYDLICEKLFINKNQIFEFYKISKRSWKISDELTTKTTVDQLFNFVAYDAFSQYTDGPLWTDSFLDYFLANLCSVDCVFVTYACTGNLKRALQRNGFLFVKRPGFSGKRDATLALRGQFMSLQSLFQNV